MPRLDEAPVEQKQERQANELFKALDYGLVGAIGHLGGKLLGFSMRVEEWECLLTLRVEFDYGRKVCFVASSDIQNTLRKAYREARDNKLKWREDRYGK